jgi:WS/DGAT/MGAT family acyltransferase
MSGVDHAWYRMDRPENLMVVNALMWTIDPLDRESLRSVLKERLVDRFPRFSHRPVESRIPLRRARWQDHDDFDLDEHLVPAHLPGDDKKSLEDFVSEQTSVPLDHDRPLWKVHHVEEYLGGSAVLFQIHHSIADGITLARVLLSLTDGSGSDAQAPTFLDPPALSLPDQFMTMSRALASAGIGAVRDPSSLLSAAATAASHLQRITQDILLPNKVPSAIVGDVGIAKQVTWSDGVSLPIVKRIGRDAGVTVNDVLITALGAALARYLTEEGTPQEMTRVYVPVNLRPLDVPMPRDLGNAFGLLILPVWTGDMNVAERLARTHETTLEYKKSPEAPAIYETLIASGFAPAKVEDFLNWLAYSKPAAVVSNVPGPRSQVTLAGAPVAGIVPFVPAIGDIALRVLFFTYQDEARVGIITDVNVFPDAHRVLDYIVDAFGELAEAVLLAEA